MPSFDITSEPSKIELGNSVDLANKEIKNRFDFKGSVSKLEKTEDSIIIYAENEFKRRQVFDILINKLTKRSVDLRFLDRGNPEKIGGDKIKEEMKIKNGIDKELAKKIIKLLKEKKIKVKTSIQGETVRVSASKKDLLQEAITTAKSIKDQPLQFGNFRD